MKKLPSWIKAIPESQAHGSGTLQKRLWRVTSDYVRIRDWYQFDSSDIVTGKKIRHWTEGDAGHWKSYSVCRGMFKFDPANIHLQSKISNAWGGQEIGHMFGENLKRRYGDTYLQELTAINNSHSLKFTDGEISGQILKVISMMEYLPEQPDYYKLIS